MLRDYREPAAESRTAPDPLYAPIIFQPLTGEQALLSIKVNQKITDGGASPLIN